MRLIWDNDLKIYYHDDDNYLPRFVEVYGHDLDYILGDEKITKYGYFISLRFKYRAKNGLYLKDEHIFQNYLQFVKILNRKLLNKKYKTRDRFRRKELPIVGVEEKHCQHVIKNHIHLVILKPDDIEEERFINSVKTSWGKTWFGQLDTDNEKMFQCTKIYSRGVIPYLFKHKNYYSPHGLICTKERRCII